MPYEGLPQTYREYLPVNERTPSLTLKEGNTPLIKAVNLSEELGIDLHFKFEGLNPTGSFKDRGMVMAVAKAMEEGSRTIMCASTGNTSAAVPLCRSWRIELYRNHSEQQYCAGQARPSDDLRSEGHCD